MPQYIWLGLIALLAATVKGYILYKTVSKTRLQSAFTILSMVLISQNALEFLTSLAVATGATFVDTYIQLVIWALCCMQLSLLHFAVVTTRGNWHGPLLFKCFAAWFLLLTGLHVNGLLIDGFIFTTYSFTTIPSDFYNLFLAYLILVGLSTTLVLVLGIYSQDHDLAERSQVALKALSTLLAAVFAIAVLRLFGFSANSTAILPVASTLFLWIVMMDQRGEFIQFERSLSDQWAMFVIKWRTLARLAAVSSINPHEWREVMEKSLVQSALKKKQAMQGAADLLGIKRTTLNSKVTKYFGKTQRSAD